MLRSTPVLLRVTKWCSYLVLGVFLLCACLFLRIVNESCSTVRAVEVQKDLCSMYHRGEIDGNMCSKLCDKKQLHLDFCGNNYHRLGRKDVQVLTCKGCDIDQSTKKLVMKMHMIPNIWSRVTNIVLGRPGMSSGDMLIETRNFTRQQIKLSFDKTNFTMEEDILSSLLGDKLSRSFVSAKDPKTAHIILKTVLSLVLQQEVISLLALKETSFMPNFYGYCGPAYFVEYTPSITSLGYVITHKIKSPELLNIKLQLRSWYERAHLALRFLYIIQRAELLSKTSLQICDLKPQNFGINAENSITLLDSDSVVFSMRTEGSTCNSDQQCDINYCSGYCDKMTNTCSDRRKNNNLQIACLNLFLGDFGLLGLLRSPPEIVRKELNDVLLRCSYPDRYNKSAVTDKVDLEMLHEIERLLRKSIS